MIFKIFIAFLILIYSLIESKILFEYLNGKRTGKSTLNVSVLFDSNTYILTVIIGFLL